MLTGTVTDDGVPHILLTVAGQPWPAIIDTGFNGELELPDYLRQGVNARCKGHIHVALGGGQHREEEVSLVAFPCDGRPSLRRPLVCQARRYSLGRTCCVCIGS